MGKVDHTRNVVLNLSLDKAFDLCIDSLRQIKRSKIVSEDRANGNIEATGGVSWKSWGEKIEFNLTKTDENTTGVKFRSQSRIRPKQQHRVSLEVDWGKNLQNIHAIEGVLGKHQQE